MAPFAATCIVTGFNALRNVAGVEITVTRGGTALSLTAVPGETVHAIEQEGVVVHEIRSRDYRVLATEYDFGSGATVPAVGDTITEDGQVYKVMASGGEAHWRYGDAFKVILHIHTKLS